MLDQVIQKLQEIISAGPTATIQKDVTTSTGLNAYNLEPAAKILQPVYSPLRNRIPRPNTGVGTAANWRVIAGLDINRTDPFTAEGTKAAIVSVTKADKAAAYKTISKGDNVSFQAEWAGRGFTPGGNKAAAVQRLLATVMQLEEKAILFGRTTAPSAPAAPTLAVATSGGGIADGTYVVYSRALFWAPADYTTLTTAAGRGKISASGTSTGAISGGAGTTNKVTAYCAPVPGAVAYEWYIGTAGSEKLVARTEIATVVISALPDGGNATKPANDAENALDFDGLFAQTAGAAGYELDLANGTSGVGTKLTLSHVDGMFQNLWDNYRADPDALVLHSREHLAISALIAADTAGNGVTVYTSMPNQTGMTGGVRYTQYVNKTTGKSVELMTHPFAAKGNILAAQFQVPFTVDGLDGAPVEMETVQEYMQLEYPVNKPAYEFEVLVHEVLKLYAPAFFGVIRNIADQGSGA